MMGETTTQNEKTSLSSVNQIVNITPDSPLFEKWLRERYSFVKYKGWVAPQSDGMDRDFYDDNPDTAHMISLDRDGDIIAGLRLTPVDNFEESLSWQMLSDDMRERALSSGVLDELSDHSLWDMTRLISGKKRQGAEFLPLSLKKHYTKLRRFQEIAKLYGRVYGETIEENEKPPMWTFTTERTFANMMKKYGMPIVEVVSGQVRPEDTEETVFGFGDPVEVHKTATSSIIGRMALRSYEGKI